MARVFAVWFALKLTIAGTRSLRRQGISWLPIVVLFWPHFWHFAREISAGCRGKMNLEA